MTYISKHFDSLSSAYNELTEQYEIDFSHFIKSKENDNTYEVEVAQTSDFFIVSCLKFDNSPSSPFEDEESGVFKEFRSADSRDTYLATLKKSSLFYLVDKYEHGSVHYSVANTRNYPDQRWDVSHGCAVYIPCNYIQEEYKKAKKRMTVIEAKNKFIADSNSFLDSYSDFCNGEIYGIDISVYDKKGQLVETDDSWGLIGFEYAKNEKESLMKSAFNYYLVLDLLKNVDIVKFENTNHIPHVSEETLSYIKKHIDLIQVEFGQYAEVYGEKVLSIVDKNNNVLVFHDNGSDKPSVVVFESSQKEIEVNPKQLAESRFLNKIKDVIRKKLDTDNQKIIVPNNN